MTGALVLVAGLVIAPGDPEIPADPAIKHLLKRACYDGHSDQTVWPWYASAPVSRLVGSRVNAGRRNLNFSEWGACAGGVHERKMKGIAEAVKDGDRPAVVLLDHAPHVTSEAGATQ
jgi:hypothetical protein